MAHVEKSRQTKAGIVSQPDADIDKPPNFELITHERKRQIEAKCLRYRQELEEDRYSLDGFERKVDEYQQSKLREPSGAYIDRSPLTKISSCLYAFAGFGDETIDPLVEDIHQGCSHYSLQKLGLEAFVSSA